MSDQFIKVKRWSWQVSMGGEVFLYTLDPVTYKQVRDYIETLPTSNGSSDNYRPESLVCKEVKVKRNKIKLTRFNK